MSADEVTIVAEIVKGPKGLTLDVDEEVRKELASAIRHFRKPGPCTVRVREGRETKTYQQLKKIHKMFALIAEETGNDKTVVKAELKEKFLSRIVDYVNMETWEVTTKQIVPSLADLDKDEMRDFIERVTVWAGEWLSMTFEVAA